MSDSMIERVAAAICGEASWSASSDSQKENFRGQAHDAIEAMREPTEIMKREGRLALDMTHPDPNLWGSEWAAMIDAALAEEIE
jgi:hypothetical protein